MPVAGVDVGSVAAKAVLLDEHSATVLSHALVPTGWNPRQAGEDALEKACSLAGLERSSLTGMQLMEITHRASFVCLMGPSGCGKSTFLRLLAGLEHPTSGEITVKGKRIEQPGLDPGMVFQDYGLFPWMTAGENIMLALEQRFPGDGKNAGRKRPLKTSAPSDSTSPYSTSCPGNFPAA